MTKLKGEQGNRTSPSEWQVTISRHRKSTDANFEYCLGSVKPKAMFTLMPQGR